MAGRLRSSERKLHKADEKKKQKRDDSRTRSKKLPARKSPSRVDLRNKSPSRTPKKAQTRKTSKSPSRKSPTRKSPSRSTPLRLHNDDEPKKTFVKLTSTPINHDDSDSDSDFKPRRSQIIARGRIRRINSETKTKILDDEETDIRNLYSGITLRSMHQASSDKAENVVHVKETFTTEKKLSEFSDEDDIIHPKKVIDSIESTPSHKVFVAEFGGWFGALFFIAFLPFEIIFLNVICNEKKCSMSLPIILEPYKELTTYFDFTAGLSFTVYALLLAVLSAMPFGGKKEQGFFNKNGKLIYVMNGLCSAVIMHLILIGLELSMVSVIDFIYQKYLQLNVASVILGILFSICLYLRSFYVPISALNPNGDTNSFIYNFFLGREINPRIFDVVDAKMFLLRILNISVLVLNSVILCKSLGLNSATFREYLNLNSLTFQPTLLTILFLLYVYFLDRLVNEATWVATFELQHEGVGYMSSVWFFATAFTYALIPKYIMDFKVELASWQLVASTVQFFIGYMLYRCSNNQKYAFRKNPYSPTVSHLETIPTCHGKKLIVSGFWGFVRHPNYLGDILMHLAFLYYVISVPPAVTCVVILPILIHRSIRDGFRCKHKYEAAWDRYCQRVKYVLVPKIY